MSDFGEVERVTKEVLGKLEGTGQRLDIVVENAGISMRAEFKDYDFKNHLSMFDININGPYLHLKCLVPHLTKTPRAQIVGITSVQGKLAPPFRTSYAGSKHAFIGILDSLRTELSGYGVTVTNIMPGYVDTNLGRNALGAKVGEKYGEI